MFKPNLKRVELLLTYKCNNRCNNCHELCTQAPYSNGDLTPDNILDMLEESIDINYIWDQISLFGGEASLHKDIIEIAEMLSIYKQKFNPTVKLWIFTNYSTAEVRENVHRLFVDYGIEPGISLKTGQNLDPWGKPIPYVTVNNSPADNGVSSTLCCYLPGEFGLAFNYLGFFPCSPMGAAARVFDYKPMCSSVKDISEEKCFEYYHMHCKHCGFSYEKEQRSIEQVSSKTWKDAFDRYTTLKEDR